MDVGVESVTLPVVAPFVAVIPMLGNALARIVNLGLVSQADGMDNIFLIIILIITDVDPKLIIWRSLSFRSFCWTFSMSEWVLVVLPLEHVPIHIHESTRQSGPLGSPLVR